MVGGGGGGGADCGGGGGAGGYITGSTPITGPSHLQLLSALVDRVDHLPLPRTEETGI